MLMNRSRAVTTKQALMADQSSFLSSPTKKPNSPISSFLNSPRFFNGFLSKSHFDTETTTMSPTSILDSENSSNFVNPFGYDRNLLKSPEITDNSFNKIEEQKPIGLALIDSINEPTNKMVLFKSKLKVQIPALNPSSSLLSPVESPKSPADFGIKTRNSQLLSPFKSTPKKDFKRQLSLKEMELSEDYTCVIIHGPNPKKTHIYDNCILENCSGDDTKIIDDKKIECGFENNVVKSESVNFLSFCHTCKDSLEQGKDIYMYRGEKAFCSQECRCQEMVFEESRVG
ncbi:hypothetical protein ACJIZ3_011759 [Penstemon smallii]|uniref:FLZ-type domain-containing protein n=1 Tax=Penstemon smallii TaxID=265156 RepID=A0ABD3UNJ2_9LAMI